MKMTLEQLLKMMVMAKDKNGDPVLVRPEFRVVSRQTLDGRVHMMIHANGHDSDTLDYYVSGNDLELM